LFDRFFLSLTFFFLYLQDRTGKPGARGGGASEGSESLSNKVRDLEAKLRGNRPTDKKPKDLIRAIGRIVFVFSFLLFCFISEIWK
jgi:hypothetical protein